jgi:hypothetical protein
VVELARNCPLLRRAKFEACELLSDASLLALARSCPKLAALNFNYCDQITDVGVAAVATRCAQLEEVRLSYTPHPTHTCAASHPHLCCYFQLAVDIASSKIEMALSPAQVAPSGCACTCTAFMPSLHILCCCI